eukprot:2745662-Rhodomonas_salina.3
MKEKTHVGRGLSAERRAREGTAPVESAAGVREGDRGAEFVDTGPDGRATKRVDPGRAFVDGREVADVGR